MFFTNDQQSLITRHVNTQAISAFIDHIDIHSNTISIHNKPERECKTFTCYLETEYSDNKEHNNINNIDIIEVEELIK